MSDELGREAKPRRGFLGIAGVAAAGLAALGATASSLRSLMPKALPEPTQQFKIGSADEFPPGTDRAVPDRMVLVMSRPEGLAVVSLVCTHLGCIVQVNDDGFACPCHGSEFDGEGRVKTGPAPRALRWLALSRSPDGAVVVDASVEVDPGTYQQV